jgi:hypothetical protein
MANKHLILSKKGNHFPDNKDSKVANRGETDAYFSPQH